MATAANVVGLAIGCAYRATWKWIPILTAGIVTFSLPAARAQGVLTEADYFDELPVVVSASRMSQPANETPTAVTVIDREMIRASGATEVADVLRLVPGMAVGFASGYTAAASYHGLSSRYARRMQVLVDGRTIYEPSFGGVNWMAIPLAIDDIERIEVVRGPAAVSHGANALLGVISITTRAAAAQEGITVQGTKGSNDIDGALVRVGRSGERFDYRFTAEHRTDGGLANILDNYFVNQLSFRGDVHRSQADWVSIALGYSDTHLDAGDAQVPPHTMVTRTRYEQLTWRRAMTPSQELNVQLYHNVARDEEAWATDQVAFARNAEKERFDAELQYGMTFNERHRVVWGGGARRDEVSDNAAFATDAVQSANMYRLFGNVEMRFGDRLVGHAGAMWEHHAFVGEDISPRVAFNYHLTPRHTLRAGVSRAYRNPVLTEERGDLRVRDLAGNTVSTILRGNGALQPERLDSYEVGYVATYPEQGLTLDLKLYRDRLEHLIRSVVEEAGGFLTFRNLDYAQITGAEVEVTAETRARQRFYLNYAYEDIDSDDVAGHYTASAPRNKVSVLALQHFGLHVEASAAYTYVGKMEWLGTGDPLNNYDRLDLRLAYLWERGRMDGEIAAVVQSVNGSSADFSASNERQRRGYLTFQLRFL